jgi:hypothetical protein
LRIEASETGVGDGEHCGSRGRGCHGDASIIAAAVGLGVERMLKRMVKSIPHGPASGHVGPVHRTIVRLVVGVVPRLTVQKALR